MNRMQPATRKSSVRFRQRSELLDFLLEVTTATSNTLDLDELMSNVAEIVKKVIPYELFAILLYSEKRQDLRIRYAVGHREEIIHNVSIGLGDGITGTAAAQREPVLVTDVRNDPRYLNVLDAVRSERPSRLEPLITGEDIMRARGIRPGPEVGRIKQKLEELVIDGEVPPDRQAVIDYLATHPQL